MDALALVRALRALGGFGAFQEVSPGVFGNNAVSEMFRNRPGGLCNYALYVSSDHYAKSAAALGHSAATGQSATRLDAVSGIARLARCTVPGNPAALPRGHAPDRSVAREPNAQVGLIDMIMLMYFGEARQRTVEEYRHLFRSTDLAITRVLPTAGAFSIVEVSPT